MLPAYGGIGPGCVSKRCAYCLNIDLNNCSELRDSVAVTSSVFGNECLLDASSRVSPIFKSFVTVLDSNSDAGLRNRLTIRLAKNNLTRVCSGSPLIFY